ncbi:MAG: hypothetical protein K9J06_04925 [Flavobacteriales bacterium]|nr:hypothetical protein [Flavobacteriales bacterium]
MSKPPTDKVFQLIKSLTKAEKRYFRLHVGKHGAEKNNHHELFDVYDGLETFTEEALLGALHNKAIKNSLPTAKSRLYDAVLRSLDDFHAKSSIDAQLKRTLHFVEILYKKSLYHQSHKLLEGAKRLAYQYDKHTSLLEIFMWEKMLIEKDNYENVGEGELEAMMAENTRIISLIEVFNDFWGIKSRLFHILNRKGKARTEEGLLKLKSIIDDTLLNRNPDHIFHESEYLYNHIYSAYYFGVGDYANSYIYLENNVRHIEANLHKFSEEPNVYFSILTNIVYIASQLHKYEEVFFYLKKLRELPATMDIENNEDLEIKLFSSANSIELTIYFLTGDFEKGLDLIPQIEMGLVQYDHKLNSVRKAFFFFNIAIIYFGAGRYNDALKWTNRLLNDIEISKSLDIYCFGQLLNLLIHIELNSKNLLPYSLRSTQRYMSTRNRYFKFEESFLEFIGKLLRSEDVEAEMEHYEVFLEKMKELKNDPLEKNAFEYFDFVSWAEAKVTGRSFAEVVREKSGLGAKKGGS